ncbi:MAG: hypothetical protein ACREB6_03435 [Rhodospirillales bacterium]
MPAVSADRAVWLVAALFAILLTVKYFPGFEQSHPFSGNAFQVIHPDAFAGDPYKSPDKPLLKRPFQLSLLYGLVKLGGEIWLDDRFVAVFYLGLVFAGLLGIDRIAGLLGITEPVERALILMLFLKDHAVLKNFVLLSHHPDVNHYALAIPVAVWLIYAALARKGLVVVLTLAALLATISMRTAVFPILYALAVVAVQGTRGERLIVAGLFVAGLVVAYVGLFHLYPMAGEQRLQLWDLLKWTEGVTSDAFYADYGDHPAMLALRNLAWIGICVGALMAGMRRYPAFNGIKVVVVVALAVWLASSLYVKFAPDVMKMPLLLPLAAVRGLGLPQKLAYVAIAAGLLHRLRDDPSVRQIVLASSAFAVLVVLGPGNHVMWGSLVAAGFAAALAVNYARHRTIKPMEPVRYLAHAVAFVVVVSFAVAAWQKAPAWKMWADTGVYGGSESAKWVGVAEYIRANTPKTASVLPLYNDPKRGLWASRTLGSRAGRAMPVPEWYGDLMNVDFWKFTDEQRQQLKRVLDAFTARDLANAAREVEKLVPVPDYIVIPSRALPNLDTPAFPYVLETHRGGFAILKRAPA